MPRLSDGRVSDVSGQIAEWLERDREPLDIYELLGKKRLDPDMDGLKAAISEATREILPYQSHADPKIAQRAMRLLTDLGGADLVVADPEKIEQHNRQVLDMLFDEYAAEHGDDVAAWDWNDLKRWLLRDKIVHPLTIEDTLAALCPRAQLRVVRPADAAASSGRSASDALEEPEAYDSAETEAPRRRSRSRTGSRRRRSGSSRSTRSSARRSSSRRHRHYDGFSDMLDELGVEPRRSTRRSRRGRRGRSSQAYGSQRVRYTYSSTAPPWFKISVVVIGVILAAAILWSVFGPQKDRSGKLILTVSPPSARARVSVNRDDVTIEEQGDRWIVTIHNAELVPEDERVTVTVSAEGYTERTLDWGPQPRQTSEQNVTLFVETKSPDSGAVSPPLDDTALAYHPGPRRVPSVFN